MRNTINYTNIQKVINLVGNIGAQTRLQDAVGIEEASKIWKAYCDVKRAEVPEVLADKTLSALLELRKLEMPEVPAREQGDSLFLQAYAAFPLSDGTVIPNGITVGYSFGGRDYILSKTKKEYVANVLACYHNTKNEDVRHRFEYTVNGHKFEDPRMALFTAREFFKDTPIFRELRKSGEVEWKEYNPYQGLDEEQIALLKAQTWDYELRHWGLEDLTAIKEIRPLMKTNPLQAKELIILTASQLGDMTNQDTHQKRCGEYLEDSYCDDNSWELDYVKREVRTSPKEREFRWALKAILCQMAREEGAVKLLNWLEKWAPTETAQTPDVEAESFKLARAIGYSQACKLYLQRHYADDWKECLAVLLGYNEEAQNAYFASEKVLKALGMGASLADALSRSTYDVFLDGAEHLENGEIDETIVLNWVRSTKLEKYDKIMGKIEKSFEDAQILRLESRQVELLAELKKVCDYEEAGGEVARGIKQSIRMQNRNLSLRIEALNNKEVK